jgi:hypothetical protein
MPIRRARGHFHFSGLHPSAPNQGSLRNAFDDASSPTAAFDEYILPLAHAPPPRAISGERGDDRTGDVPDHHRVLSTEGQSRQQRRAADPRARPRSSHELPDPHLRRRSYDRQRPVGQSTSIAWRTRSSREHRVPRPPLRGIGHRAKPNRSAPPAPSDRPRASRVRPAQRGKTRPEAWAHPLETRPRWATFVDPRREIPTPGNRYAARSSDRLAGRGAIGFGRRIVSVGC